MALQPDSIFRLDTMRRGLAAAGGAVSIAKAQAILRDHRDLPEAVAPPESRQASAGKPPSVISVVADLDAGELVDDAGPPVKASTVR